MDLLTLTKYDEVLRELKEENLNLKPLIILPIETDDVFILKKQVDNLKKIHNLNSSIYIKKSKASVELLTRFRNKIDELEAENVKLMHINKLQELNKLHNGPMKPYEVTTWLTERKELFDRIANLKDRVEHLESQNKSLIEGKQEFIEKRKNSSLTTQWLCDKMELGMVILRFIKSSTYGNDHINPSIYGSFLTILFMNAFGIKADVSNSDLDIVVAPDYNTNLIKCSEDAGSSIMEFMCTLRKKLQKKVEFNKIVKEGFEFKFCNYVLVDMISFNFDTLENKDEMYFEIPHIKLTLKDQNNELFYVDITGWKCLTKEVDVTAKGFTMSSSNIGIDSGRPLIETIYKISKGETFINQNLSLLQVKLLENKDLFKRFALMLVQRLPKTMFLGLKLVGYSVPYLNYHNGQFVTNIKCKCIDKKEISINLALTYLAKSTTCITCKEQVFIIFDKVDQTRIPYVRNYVANDSDKLVVTSRIKPNMFIKTMAEASEFERLIYDKSCDESEVKNYANNDDLPPLEDDSGTTLQEYNVRSCTDQTYISPITSLCALCNKLHY
jgi:hypothetical protein